MLTKICLNLLKERKKIREDLKLIPAEKQEAELIDSLAHRNLDLKVKEDEAKTEHDRAVNAEKDKVIIFAYFAKP